MNQLARLQEEVDKLHQQYDEETLAEMGRVCQLSFDEHTVYQQWKSLAQVHELISLELALWLYNKLGSELNGPGNGGWPVGVDDAEKVLVTALFGRLQEELDRRKLL